MVQAAFAADEMEAEMIQGLLESGGVPSLLQPTGFNGRQMLGGMAGAAGVLHGRGRNIPSLAGALRRLR